MTRQSRDIVYGRQGGRVVPVGDPTAPWPDCDVCDQPMTAGQTDRHHECQPAPQAELGLFDKQETP